MPISQERLQAVARRLVRECARVRSGEDVYIEGRADALDYMELLAFECELVGAYPLVVPHSDAYVHRRLTELPAAQLETKGRGWIELIKAADVVIAVAMDAADPALFSDITPAQRGAAARGRELLFDHIFAGGRRWIGTDYPTRGQAAAFKVDYETYQQTFWDALDLDYGELAARAERVMALLRGAREVHITSPKGTDVRLGIEGRPLDADCGVTSLEAPFTNLPAGEVCLAPLEDQAEGTVVFDLAFWDGRRVEDLEMRFVAGRATPLRARREFEYVRDVLANADDGAYMIGELGIGTNPNVPAAIGYTLTDEKILGTVHIALGENKLLGGANASSLHWDMMVLRPTVHVDGRPLLVDGEMKV